MHDAMGMASPGREVHFRGALALVLGPFRGEYWVRFWGSMPDNKWLSDMSLNR